MQLLNIVSNGYEVLYSGSVFSFKQNDLEFEISPFRIIITFLNDDKDDGVETEVIENNSLKIKLFNYNNSLGTGISEPLKIGTIENKDIYLDFTVYALSKNTSKNFHYTFFQEK